MLLEQLLLLLQRLVCCCQARLGCCWCSNARAVGSWGQQHACKQQ
jgi:hypothetical protein